MLAEVDPSGEHVEAVPRGHYERDDCAALVALAQVRFGSVDALDPGGRLRVRLRRALRDRSSTTGATAFETNVLGVLTVLRPVATAMKESGGGAVVLIGSQSMFKPSLPQAGYAASKGALLSTMYYLADELGADNIRCNMVVPSWMWGPPVQMFVKGQREAEGHLARRRPSHEIVGDLPAASHDRGRRGCGRRHVLRVRPRKGRYRPAPAGQRRRDDALIRERCSSTPNQPNGR